MNFNFSRFRAAQLANDSAFHVGQKVRANADVQGMKKGQVYTVTDIDEQNTGFGTIVQYQLDGKMWISNGHVLLSRA